MIWTELLLNAGTFFAAETASGIYQILLGTLAKSVRASPSISLSQIFADQFEEVVLRETAVLSSSGQEKATIDREQLEVLLAEKASEELFDPRERPQLIERFAARLADDAVLRLPGGAFVDDITYRQFLVHALHLTWERLLERVQSEGDEQLGKFWIQAGIARTEEEVRALGVQLRTMSERLESFVAEQLTRLAAEPKLAPEFRTLERLDTIIPRLLHRHPGSAGSFYKGSVEWQDILADYDVRRSLVGSPNGDASALSLRRSYADCLAELAAEAREPGLRVAKVFGEAGSGKTTLMMRLALDLYREGLRVIAKRASAREASVEEVRRFQEERPDESVVLVVDDAVERIEIEALATLCTSLGHSFPLLLLLSARPGHWRYSVRKGGRDLSLGGSTTEFQLPSLDSTEVLELLRKLEVTGNLGRIASYPPPERAGAFFERLARNELLVALREAIEEDEDRRTFDEIIIHEFRTLPTEEAREAYLLVALSHSYGVVAPQRVVLRGIGREGYSRRQVREALIDPSRRVILPTGPGDSFLTTRHKVIASVVCRAAVEPEERAGEISRLLQAADIEDSEHRQFVLDLVHSPTLTSDLSADDVDNILIEALRVLTDLRDKSVITHMRGQLALNRRPQDIETAERLFQHSIELFGRNAYAYHSYGWSILWRLRNDREAALRVLHEGLLREPGSAHLRYACAVILVDAGEFELAEKHLRTGLERNPEDAFLLEQYVALLQETDRLEEARALSSFAIERQPAVAAIVLRHASILQAFGEPEAALPLFQRALAINPDEPRLRSAYAVALRILGRPSEALMEFEQALAIDANYPLALTGYAAVLRDLGRGPEAVSVLERRLTRTPDHAPTHAVLGVTLAELGELEEAASYLQRAHQLAPGNLRTVRHLARVWSAQGRYEEAARVLRKALERQPDQTGLLLDLASALRASDQLEEATVCLRQLVNTDADNAYFRGVLGSTLHRLGRPDEALPHLALAVELEPRNPVSRSHYAAVLRATGRLEEALAEYERGLASDPDNPLTLTAYAMTLRNLNRREEAIVVLQRVLKQVPSRPATLAALGIALYELGELNQAREYLERAREFVPDDPRTLRHLARVLGAQGQYEDAAEMLRQALERKPGQRGLLLDLARALRAASQLEEAVVYLQQLVLAEPDSAYFLGVLGSTLKALGRYDEALPHLARAVELAPQNPLSRSQYAAALRATGRWDEALEEYERTLALDPDDPVTLTAYAVTLRNLDRHQESIAVLQRVLERAPSRPATLVALGIALYELGELDQARDYLERARELTPDDPRILRQLARVLGTQGRYEDAVEVLRRALEEQPGQRVLLLDLARALRAAGQFEEAVVYLQQLVLAEPDSAYFLGVLGSTLKALGRYDEALPHLARAVELAPQNPLSRSQYAVTLRVLGRREESLIQFEHALRLDPDNPIILIAYSAVLRSAERHEESLAALRRAIANAGQDAGTLAILGVGLLELGELDQARNYLERAHSLAPRDPRTSRHLGRVLTALGDHQEAMRILREAIEFLPNDCGLLIELAEVLRASGDSKAAVDYLRRVIEINPQHAFGLGALGSTLHRLGRSAEALAYLARALELQSNNPFVGAVYAAALRETGQIKPALELLETGQYDLHHPWVLGIYASLLLRTGRLGEAERLLREGLQQQPHNTQLKRRYAQALRAFGRFEEAEQQLRELLALEPGNASARIALALLLRELRRDIEAEEQFEAGIVISPDFSGLRVGYAVMLKEMGRHRDALKQIDIALRYNPNEDSKAFRATLLLACEEFDEARAAIEEQLASPGWTKLAKKNLRRDLRLLAWKQATSAGDAAASEDVNSRLQYARNLIEHRNFQRAVEEFREVLHISPNHTQALVKLGRTLVAKGDAKEGLGYLDRALTQDGGLQEARFELARGAIKVENYELAQRQLAWLLEQFPGHAGYLRMLGYTLGRAKLWADAETAYNDAIASEAAAGPRSQVVKNLAQLKIEEGSVAGFEEAWQLLARAWALQPGDPAIYNTRRELAQRLGRSPRIEDPVSYILESLWPGDPVDAQFHRIKESGEVEVFSYGVPGRLPWDERALLFQVGQPVLGLMLERVADSLLVLRWPAETTPAAGHAVEPLVARQPES